MTEPPRPRLALNRQSPSLMLDLFVPPALLMLALALVALIALVIGAGGQTQWLVLHLAFLGGVSQLIIGVGQFFVCSFLATSPPPRRLRLAQVNSWNVGVVLVAVGVVVGPNALCDLGALTLLVSLALFVAGIRGMRARSLRRAEWAVLWYLASAVFLAVGLIIGVLLARHTGWSHGSLLGAHMSLNIGGWIGTAIIGTLQTFYPTLTGGRLPYPRLEAPTWGLWLGGITALALAFAVSSGVLAALACAALLASALLLLFQMGVALARRSRALGWPARLVSAGQLALVCALAALPFALNQAGLSGFTLNTGAGTVLLVALLAWVWLTVAGALWHLLAVMAHLRRIAPQRP